MCPRYFENGAQVDSWTLIFVLSALRPARDLPLQRWLQLARDRDALFDHPPKPPRAHQLGQPVSECFVSLGALGRPRQSRMLGADTVRAATSSSATSRGTSPRGSSQATCRLWWSSPSSTSSGRTTRRSFPRLSTETSRRSRRPTRSSPSLRPRTVPSSSDPGTLFISLFCYLLVPPLDAHPQCWPFVNEDLHETHDRQLRPHVQLLLRDRTPPSGSTNVQRCLWGGEVVGGKPRGQLDCFVGQIRHEHFCDHFGTEGVASASAKEQSREEGWRRTKLAPWSFHVRCTQRRRTGPRELSPRRKPSRPAAER